MGRIPNGFHLMAHLLPDPEYLPLPDRTRQILRVLRKDLMALLRYYVLHRIILHSRPVVLREYMLKDNQGLLRFSPAHQVLGTFWKEQQHQPSNDGRHGDDHDEEPPRVEDEVVDADLPVRGDDDPSYHCNEQFLLGTCAAYATNLRGSRTHERVKKNPRMHALLDCLCPGKNSAR